MLCRDDEHRTGLMLAAAEGHIPVMKILLDNHASVNDGDKMKARILFFYYLLSARYCVNAGT